MNIRARKTFAPLKTKIYKERFLGGNTSYCDGLCGYVYTERGLAASFTPLQSKTGAQISNIRFAEYVPQYGYSVLISKFGNMIKWNSTDLSEVKTSGLVPRTYPFSIHFYNADGKYNYVLVAGNKFIYFDYGNKTEINISQTVFGGTYHYGRVFAIDDADRCLIRWSGASAPYDFTSSADGAGYVILSPRGGDCLNVLSLGEKLLVVRRNGITIMRAYGDPANFRVEPTENYLAIPDVKANTSVICRGQLYFCTQDGMFVFDGAKIEKINLPDIADGAVYTNAQCYDGRKIYLQYDKSGKTFFAEYDTDLKAFSPFAPGCEIMWKAEGGFMCIKNGYVYGLVKGNDDDGERFWTSKKFGNKNKVITLRRLYLNGSENIKVTATHENYSVTCSGNGWHNVMERGCEFTFTVSGAGELLEAVAEWEENA